MENSPVYMVNGGKKLTTDIVIPCIKYFQKRRKAHTLLMGEDLRGLPLVLHIHRICGDERWGWYTLGSGNPTVPQACPTHPHVVLDVKKQA